MSSSLTQKIFEKLKKGYAPTELSPEEKLTSAYKNVFKPIVNRKDFNLLFELFDTNDVILRAWSFLGLHHILEENSVYEEERIKKIQELILEVLKDYREIKYYGDSSELRTSLREHHIRRICELRENLNFKPAFEYCLSFDKVTDNVVTDLTEHVLSKSGGQNVETLILKLANNTGSKNYHLKTQIVKSFENFSQEGEVTKINEITSLFKSYLTQINEDKINEEEFLKNVKLLQENIFRVGAILGVSLEEETLEFLNSLKYPYSSLHLIAKRYYDNDEFLTIILRKLEESENPNFIAEILKAILVLKDKVENWEELIIKNVKKFEIVDGNLINDMQESNLINQELILKLFNEGDKWSLEFIRESLVDDPELFKQWQDVKNEFIKILRLNSGSFLNEKEIILKKEMILKVIIDLQVEDLIEICLEVLQSVDDKNLKKLAAFSILKFGDENLLLEMKGIMKNDPNTAKLVLNLIDSLNRNEWKFFY
ncbi:MAG: hypothetical protein ACXABG_14200 [Promethearchaeota archaeon]|jgi:hypothetical protein